MPKIPTPHAMTAMARTAKMITFMNENQIKGGIVAPQIKAKRLCCGQKEG